MQLRNVNEEPVQDVIETLERALEKAKSGELRNVAVIGAVIGNASYYTYSCTDGIELIGMREYAKIKLAEDLQEQ